MCRLWFDRFYQTAASDFLDQTMPLKCRADLYQKGRRYPKSEKAASKEIVKLASHQQSPVDLYVIYKGGVRTGWTRTSAIGVMLCQLSHGQNSS